MNDQQAILHERVGQIKKWANSQRKISGNYPEAKELEFVALLSTSSAH